MDIKELRENMDNDESKVIILEDGEPAFVVISYRKYKKLIEASDSGENNIENKESDEEIKPSQAIFSITKREDEGRELTIEDLPF